MLASQPSGASHERIGRYEVLRKIATGGMAELFLAKQVGMEGFERVVALKRILAHLAYDEEFINMFRDEARIVAKLSHPNIVQIFDLGKADDTYFIAMEYIPGRNLSSVAKKARARGEKLPPHNIARCVAQACEGLHYAHTRSDLNGKPLKIVHRDVSPQNIIVAFSGTVKLVDFGIAKAATKIAHTRAGVLKGKYAYMSPEQIRGEEVDARSDLFAVGIVLYELLCGRRPFEKENSIQTLKAIVQEQHRDCRELNSAIPDTLAEIIDRALTKDRNQRFQDAQELQLALEDFVSGSGQRVNNLTVANWITKLFEEELSREQGGTVVFQGIGEVILPDVDEAEDKARDSEAPAPEPEPEPEPEPAPSQDSGPGMDQPLSLSRGRGGGSIGLRPPIPAPSNSLPEDSNPERESLIEEGVIDRPIERNEGGYDDDATVMGTGAAPVPERASTEVPPTYSDDKTEFAGSHNPPPEPDVAEVAQGLGDRAVSAAHTIVPDSPLRAPSDNAIRDASPAGLLKPLADVSAEAFDDANDDPWDEATVGYPDGGLPDEVGSEPPADAEPLAGDDWGELSDDDFQDDATLAGLPEAWDDPTAATGHGLHADRVSDPLVQEPQDYDDSEPLEIDLDDPEDDVAEPESTVTNGGLEEFGADATIAVPSISDEIIERHQSQYGVGFDDSPTMGALQTPEEVADADVEPLDFADVTDEPPAAPEQWASDATLAGAPMPSLPGVAGLDPDEEFEVEALDPDLEIGFDDEIGTAGELPDGLALELDDAPAMDEEPELPVPKSDRDIDLDARTVAGTTSDYLVAGVRPPEGVTYDADHETVAPPEPDNYDMPTGPKPKRGHGQLGAIKLARVAVPRGPGSEERTEGDVPAYESAIDTEGELPGVQEHLPVEVSIDEDAPPVEPSPLEDPEPAVPSEPELPVALPQSTAASAKDEYSSALLAPKLPSPMNVSEQGDGPAGPMAIGSTNVPPANLSLSQMLEHPSRASKSKMVPAPRAASTSGRSASIVGRQIREVARSGNVHEADVPGRPMITPAAITSSSQQTTAPIPAPPGAPDALPLPPMDAAFEVPPEPGGASRGRGRRLLIGGLVTLAVVLLLGAGYVALPIITGGDGLSLFGSSEPRLTIKTNPPGAEVYVNNARQQGTTPLTISGLEPGVTYTVRLVRDGYDPVTQPVRLPKDRPLIWRIPLSAKKK